MQSSLEMRWFFDGTADARTQAWLSTLRLANGDREETRCDRYLATRDDRTGVKVRERRLELKWRLRSRPCTIGAIHGRLERWEKSGARAERGLAAALGWIAVTKRRVQRRCGAAALELTELEVQGRTLWTLAIESTGVAHEARRAFAATLLELARSVPEPERFTLARSYGYPCLLCALAS